MRARSLGFFAAAITLALVGCATNGPEPLVVDRSTCEQLRDHVADVRVGPIDAKLHPEAIAYRDALRGTLGEDYLASCQRTLNPASMKCALAAQDQDALSACGKVN